ncbi:hypothetical protein [Vulcanisaeta thermophila]|uniref:hypothetical protein n=1 Tax=Vulcanisaeta thermophila TaxID=867917 RepID=UPI000852CADF|nr:hypothetical protein [Vulcanisaeta thermophila]
MAIIIKCHSCGFVFHADEQLRSIDDVLKQWGYRCPVCLSPLSKIPLSMSVMAARGRVKNRSTPVA